jgi:serine/threonine protein kinase
MDKEQARLQALVRVSDQHSRHICLLSRSLAIAADCLAPRAVRRAACRAARRQMGVSDEATGLVLAPVEPAVWVEKHNGYFDDAPEQRSELGKGAFAVIQRMATREGLHLAVKRFQRRDMVKIGLTEDAVVKEAEMLSRLQHPHVVRYLGLLRTHKYLLLVMELADGGSLAEQVRLRPPPALVEGWVRQLASALEFIHWRGCVHRDVKNANLLLTDGGSLRLADFGLSFLGTSSQASHCMSRSGTSDFFSPERGHGRVYGQKADMWAVGCCILELMSGIPLTGPIWHEGDEVTRKREALICSAGVRCHLPPPPPLRPSSFYALASLPPISSRHAAGAPMDARRDRGISFPAILFPANLQLCGQLCAQGRSVLVRP